MYKKIIIFLYIFSQLNDLLGFTLLGNIRLHQFLVIIYFPSLFSLFKKIKKIKWLLKYLTLEWKYLAFLFIIFGVFQPWEFLDQYRSFSQRAFGRGFISMVRILLEIFSMLFPLFLVKKWRIKLKDVVYLFGIAMIVTFVIGVFDLITGYPIKALIPNARIIPGRITALNGEPRVFGRIMLFCFIFLLFFKNQLKKNSFSFLIGVSIVGIILSTSASTYVVFMLVLAIQFLMQKKGYLVLAVSSSLVLLIFGAILFDTIKKSNIVPETTLRKIELVLGLESRDKRDEHYTFEEPAFFSRLEVFDRAAMNFLWQNPIYLITGVGPNLISIPSSSYLTELNKIVYGEVINSVPHTYLINILSRSGLFGLICVFLFFKQFNKLLRNQDLGLKKFFWSVFIVNLLIISSIYYFMLGVLIIYILKSKYANYSNPNFKLSKIHKRKLRKHLSA
ncbi:O-antigen ligase family protein [Flagellimonas marinaquae]